MSNVAYRSTYHNTNGDDVVTMIEILDTEPVAQVFNFECVDPDESFEGISLQLDAGIYPTKFTFGMYLRSYPINLSGTVYGPSSGFWDSIFTAAEGRFKIRLTQGSTVQFIGNIIYDQCTLKNEEKPLMTITAVDGLNRLQDADYISEVGQIKYYTKQGLISPYDDSPLLYDGPTTGVTVPIISHYVNRVSAPLNIWNVVDTWAYREMFSIESPGDGWVFQGEGRWAKTISYTNEKITDNGPVSYSLTRDIDDEKHRTVLEYITRAIAETKLGDEYSGAMFDIAIEWREHSMTTGDPAALMRLHEDPMIGKTWSEAVGYICDELEMRVYYSGGMYHFEQIPQRDSTTFVRYVYNADGTSAGAAVTTNLDLNFNTIPVKPGSGGSYGILAPLKSIEAKITLDNSNLLEGIDWRDGHQGERYLGRIKQVDGDQKLYIRLNCAVTSSFDPSILALFSQSTINLICEHVVTVYYQVRLTNINTGTTYWLEPDLVGNQGDWQISFNEINFPGTRFGQPERRYSVEKFGYTVDRIFHTLAETLPGSTNDMYDIHVSLRYEVIYQTDTGFWTILYPTSHYVQANTASNELRLYSEAALEDDKAEWVESGGGAELVATSTNNVSNSEKVKIDLKWADTGQHKKSIEIYTGSVWQRSAEWSIGGTGTPVTIMQLLVDEKMSLRTLPKKIYSGSFVTSLPNSENRFQIESDFYLPLQCSRDTNYDTITGQFLQIAKTTPPDFDIIMMDVLNDPTPFPSDPDSPPSEPTLYFVTNEAITAGATLTECDIENTLMVYVASGETVAIVNLTTGETENVTLTQEILPTDTVMYFESNVMAYSYPDASPIVIQDGDVQIDAGGSLYSYSNELYNGLTHTVPVLALDMTPLAGLSTNQINKKIVIHRNGQRMFPIETPPSPNSQAYWYDTGANELSFNVEFVDENIVISIDLKA